jgi:hypothetical protein
MPRAKTGIVERRCLVSGKSGTTSALIRFVADPDGHVIPDVGNDLPGRGAWITSQRALIDTAVKRGQLRRYFGRKGSPVFVDPKLADRIENALSSRCLNYLGLAKRAGQIVAGYEKVRAALKGDQVAARIEAVNASAADGPKLDKLSGDIPVIEWFSVEELSLALGRQNVVHAALAPGGLADCFLTESLRLGGFREIIPRPVSVKANNV